MASAVVSGDFLQYNSARRHAESSISAGGSREKEDGMEMKIYLDGYPSGHRDGQARRPPPGTCPQHVSTTETVMLYV